MHAASGVRGTLYTSIKYTHDGWPPVQVQQNGSWVLDFDFNAVDETWPVRPPGTVN